MQAVVSRSWNTSILNRCFENLVFKYMEWNSEAVTKILHLSPFLELAFINWLRENHTKLTGVPADASPPEPWPAGREATGKGSRRGAEGPGAGCPAADRGPSSGERHCLPPHHLQNGDVIPSHRFYSNETPPTFPIPFEESTT